MNKARLLKVLFAPIVLVGSVQAQELTLSNCYKAYRAREADLNYRSGLVLGQSVSTMNGPGFPDVPRMIEVCDSNATRYERIAGEYEKDLKNPKRKERRAQALQAASETRSLKAYFKDSISQILTRIDKLPRPRGTRASDWMGSLFSNAYEKGWFCGGKNHDQPLTNLEMDSRVRDFTSQIETRLTKLVDDRKKLLRSRTGSDELFNIKLESKNLFNDDEIINAAFEVVQSTASSPSQNSVLTPGSSLPDDTTSSGSAAGAE